MLAPAAAYAGLAFAAGFALGVVRAFVVTPAVGRLPAVLLEIPLMLSLCWVLCGWVMRRFTVPAASRMAVGAVAFALLMALEWAMALAFGRTAAEIAASYATPEGAAGLVAQLVFATFPWLRARI